MTDIIHIGNQLPSEPPHLGSTIDELIDRFLAELQAVPKTKDSYRNGLKQYILWIESQNLQLKDITKKEVSDYNSYLISEERKLKSYTVNGYLVALRTFYTWLESYKLYPNVAKGLKPQKVKKGHKKMHLTNDESKKLLEHFQTQPLRDIAMISTMLRCGLRSIEIVRLDIGDIVQKSGKRVMNVMGKGRVEKDEFVILTDKAYIPIANYLATRPEAQPAEPLFVSESNNNLGGRLDTRTVSGVAKEGLRAIGLDSSMYSCHSLRHSAAVAMIKAGAQLDAVQGVLRHSDPSTTQIYLESIADEERIRKATEGLLDDAF